MEVPYSLDDQAASGPVTSEEDVNVAFFSIANRDSASSGTPSTHTSSLNCSEPFLLPSTLDGRDLAAPWQLSAADAITSTKPPSFFDWNNWEDWTQWDGDNDLLKSPASPATDNRMSYTEVLPHSAGRRATAPIDRNKSDVISPLGHTQVPVGGSLQSPANFNPSWTEEFLNLGILEESELRTDTDTYPPNPQFAQSYQTSPLHSSDRTEWSMSSRGSDRCAPAGISPEPSHNPPNKKRKPSVNEDEAGSASPGRLPRAKAAHNIIEKRYRTNLNDRIDALRDRLPNLQAKYKRSHQSSDHNEDEDRDACDDRRSRGQKINKAAVLSEAVDYIEQLEENIKKHNDQMATMQVRLDVFKALAAARSPETDSGRGQEPRQWGGARENVANLQYNANTGTINQASVSSRTVRPAGRKYAGRGGYMSKLMVGSLAGLMVMQGLGENEQVSDGSSARGLFSVPTEYIGKLGMFMGSLGTPNTAESSLLLHNFHFLFKVLLLFGAVVYIISPSFFDSKSEEQAKTVPLLALKSAPPPGSPLELRRSAWTTAIQTVWVPRRSFLEQFIALLLKFLKLGVRNVVGWRGYLRLTGATEEQEVARVRAWEIAIDAQLTGGDGEINLSRVALTILASETLPITPYRLMLKALHIHVLLREVTNRGCYGRYLYRSIALKFAKYQWIKARKLQNRIGLSASLNNSSEPSGSDALPEYLANLLELDIDIIMQDAVVQRAYNLAWDRPTDEKSSVCIDGMNSIVNDPAIGSPLDALSAWCSCIMLHRALINFLGAKTGVATSNIAFQHDLDFAVKISPTGSSVQSYGLVARAVLLSVHQGANIAAALQNLPPLSKSGTRTPTMADATSSRFMTTQTSPELRQALQWAMAATLLKHTQYKEEAIALIRKIQVDNEFGLLGFTAAYNWLDAAFRDNIFANETKEALENVSCALKLWMSGKQGRNSGLGKNIKCEIAMLCVEVLSWLVGIKDTESLDDQGYGSMSDGSII